jgi:hypothetical protein
MRAVVDHEWPEYGIQDPDARHWTLLKFSAHELAGKVAELCSELLSTPEMEAALASMPRVLGDAPVARLFDADDTEPTAAAAPAAAPAAATAVAAAAVTAAPVPAAAVPAAVQASTDHDGAAKQLVNGAPVTVTSLLTVSCSACMQRSSILLNKRVHNSLY